MKTNNNQQQALKWWDNLLFTEKVKFNNTRKAVHTLLNNEIETIWKKETQEFDDSPSTDTNFGKCLMDEEDYDYTKLPMNTNLSIPNFITTNRNPVICLNCKEIFNNPITRCNCGSTSFQSTHPHNTKFVKDNKQPKEFNPELFKAYINKYSKDNKKEMFVILAKELGVPFSQIMSIYF